MNHSKSFGGRLSASLLAILALGVMSTSAVAATATTTFQVSATVQATCTVSPSAGLGFGTYTGVQADVQTSLLVTCTNTTPYQIGLDAGNSGGTTTTRLMKNAGTTTTLQYKLFQDSGRTINWGNTPGTDTPASANGNGSAQTVNIFGRLLGGQYVTPNASPYTDTITATVTY